MHAAVLDDHAEAASDDAEDQPDDQLGAEELSELDEEDYLDDDDDDFQGSETSAGAMVDIADTDWYACPNQPYTPLTSINNLQRPMMKYCSAMICLRPQVVLLF